MALAGRLGGALRQSDTVSRYGGDTASLGVAIYPDDGLDAVALIAAADAAMYVAKRDGGGVYRCFRPCMP